MDLIVRQLVMRFRQYYRVTLSIVRRLQIGTAYERPIELKKSLEKMSTLHI